MLPGYYRINLGGSSYRELLRMGGIFAFPTSVYLKWTGYRINDFYWFPALLKDMICRPEDISSNVLAVLEEKALPMRKQGYKDAFHVKNSPRTVFKASTTDGGGLYLLKDNIACIILYVESLVQLEGAKPIKQAVMAFVSVHDDLSKGVSTSNKMDGMDPHPDNDVCEIRSNDIERIHRKHLQRIERHERFLATFRDPSRLIGLLDESDRITTEWRIGKGLYEYIGDTVPDE